MRRGQKIALGLAVAGGTALGISVLSRRAKAAPPVTPTPPPSLVQGYLNDIAAASTLADLEAVRARFEVDRTAGKLTQDEYQQVYNAYVARYNELSAGVVTALNIKVVKPDTLMPAPIVFGNGTNLGLAPVLWKVDPGTYTISWQQKPGGDNPSPGVAYYQAPPDRTVTVTAGQTLAVTGTYTIVPLQPADVTFVSFGFDGQGPNPTLTPGTHVATVVITNPTSRSVDYVFYSYRSQPDPTSPSLGSLGYDLLMGIAPGTWSAKISVTIPPEAGTFPVWLGFYDRLQTTYLKSVNTGTTYTVAAAPPTGWPIETQLASIMPYLVLVGVYRGGFYYTYVPNDPSRTNVFEIFAGETFEVNVKQACTLTYGGWTWQLAAGYNLWLVWGSPPPPPPPSWPIVTQLSSISPYVLRVTDVAGTLWYDSPPAPGDNLKELIPGQNYWIEVLQACLLSYGGKSWNLAADWNLITW